MQAGPGRQHCTHRVEQGAAEPKNTLFHTELEIWSVACWGDSHGVGAGPPGDGTGGGWAGLAVGHSREAGAPSLAHSSWEQLGQLCPLTQERGQCQCRCNSTPLTASHGPGPRSEVGGTGRLQRQQDPGCARSTALLRAGWHERPGTEQQQCPTARREHHGHRHGTGQAGHPPPATAHCSPAGRKGSAQRSWHGAARARNGLSSASAGAPRV